MSGPVHPAPGAPRPLAGTRVIEVGGGVAGAWAGRLLADLGAEVLLLAPEGGDPLARRREVPGDRRTEGLLLHWLSEGKTPLKRANLDAAVAKADLVLLGESAPRIALPAAPRLATVDLSWFGHDGPRADWRANDLAIQALVGILHLVGRREGPPQQPGDLQAAMVGGVHAAIAALAALLAPAPAQARRFDVNILEANLCLADLAVADREAYGPAATRVGVNRFYPTTPVSIHRCAEGWLGLTVLTPDQWAGFCKLIRRPDWAADPGLATIQQRAERVGELEEALDEILKAKTATEWAAMGREARVPMVVVPDAEGIATHPVFTERRTLAPIRVDGKAILAPQCPAPVAAPAGPGARPDAQAPDAPLLSGVRIADFSMGWAGPLATRILADMGAEVIKIEAGRYPDWWRATLWDAESIASHQYEKSRRFAAVNRNKKSVSFDLTTEEGRRLARALVAASDAVAENHAAGVLARLGMGWEQLSKGRDDLVMVSMSAFGADNSWSDTRAYGSTLEQGSGLPSLRGRPEDPPTMGHIAYGDPIGGIYGAVALLAGLIHRRRTGAGQWVNMSQIEALLPFTAPGLLAWGATGEAPARIANRHVDMVPHGVFAGRGEDRWLAVAVDREGAWLSLCAAIGRPDLAEISGLDARRAREDEIEQAVADWARDRDVFEAASTLQAAGVIAAPVMLPLEVRDDPALSSTGAHLDLDRPHLGPQRQFALPILEDGRRAPVHFPAPLLGGDTKAVLASVLGIDAAGYEALVASGVVSLRPTALRAVVKTAAPETSDA